jgi:hypothetical protein
MLEHVFKIENRCFETYLKLETSMKLVLTNENGIAVPRVGSALEADKKINLALEISVIVHAPKASWTTAQRRPVDVRGDGLPPAGGMSLARSARHVKVHQDASNPAGANKIRRLDVPKSA